MPHHQSCGHILIIRGRHLPIFFKPSLTGKRWLKETLRVWISMRLNVNSSLLFSSLVSVYVDLLCLGSSVIFQRCLTFETLGKRCRWLPEITVPSVCLRFQYYRCIKLEKLDFRYLFYFQITSDETCNLSFFCLINNLMNWRHMTSPSTV